MDPGKMKAKNMQKKYMYNQLILYIPGHTTAWAHNGTCNTTRIFVFLTTLIYSSRNIYSYQKSLMLSNLYFIDFFFHCVII